MPVEDRDLNLKTPFGKFNCRAAYLLFCKDRVLIHKDPEGRWLYSPGGRIKFGEDTKEALKRELYEETGITEDLHFRFAGVVENFFEMDGQRYHEYMFAYAAELESQIAIPDTDHAGYPQPHCWLTEEELKASSIMPKFMRTRLFEMRHEFMHYIHYDV